jgi:cytochrome c oxidase assembly factor CtaG
VNSILHVKTLTSTAKVQSIIHALQEIHLILGGYMFLLQDPVEAVAN